MTTLATPRSRTATPVTVPVRWVPWAAGVVAVVTRLTWAGRGLGSDEAGYLTVARQWSPGPSLYGRYWVDRPPLLITIDRLAAQLGGAPALRVTGAVAVLVTVLAVATVVRRLTGSVVAAAWGAGCAAVLLASPVAGAYEVNGELLAAPFTTLGVLGVAVAAKARRPRERWTGGLLAGAGLAAAVLVKQNMVDVLVVAGAAALVALATRRVGLRAVMVAGAAAAGGAVAVGAAVLGWAAAHGTSPGGVWWAMYPFRVAAGETLAGSPGTAAHQRTLVMLACALVSGLLPALAVTVGSWRRLGPRRAALLVVLVWTAWVGPRSSWAGTPGTTTSCSSSRPSRWGSGCSRPSALAAPPPWWRPASSRPSSAPRCSSAPAPRAPRTRRSGRRSARRPVRPTASSSPGAIPPSSRRAAWTRRTRRCGACRPRRSTRGSPGSVPC
ncbi:MAG: glycosyltransferase family 39 protein [Aeromicrobium erythreum]